MKKALLLIDLQNDYFDGGKFPLWNTEKTLENILEAIKIAKDKNIEIINIKHVADKNSGIAPFFNEETHGVEIISQIKEVTENNEIVIKHYADAFYGTNLEEILKKLNVQEIFVCGMMTQNCVTHTAISKCAEKYKVSIIKDCCTTVNEPIHMIGLHAVSTRVDLIDFKDIK